MELRKFIGSKIKEFRTKRGMNQDRLADLLDTTKQTVSRYEKGERQANQDILFELSKIFNVSVDDFFPSAEEKTIELPSNLYTYLPTAISAGLPFNVDGITNADKIDIPDSLMGKYAGNKNIVFSRICGDSMDKGISDGSLIAIKSVSLESLKNGDMVVFSTNHEYSVKYFYKTDNKLIFKPASTNEAHHEQHYDLDANIQIHGKVVLYLVELD